MIKSEQKLIQILRKNDPGLFKLGKYDVVDCFSPKYYQYLELKCRKGSWNDWGIEKEKYDKIILYPNIRYVVWGDNGLWSWDLMQTPVPKWVWTYGPTQTEFSDEQVWEWKWVAKIHVTYAQDLKYLLTK